MKSFTQTLFATVFAAILLGSSSMTAFAADKVKAESFTKLAIEAKSFNKIWVAGNVRIVLTQTDKEGVYVDEFFNKEKTSVMSKGQTLYVNSMELGQVTIHVSLKDLVRIEAAGRAVVVTSNNFNVKYLQVFLSQNAKAKVSAIAGSLYTVINDDAKLRMSGSADQHTLIAKNMKNVKFDNFVSLNINRPTPDLMVKSDSIAKAK
jgi:hypothetical protein